MMNVGHGKPRCHAGLSEAHRFDWAERHKVLHYTVKDTHGTVLGYGTIPARSSQCSASWTASDHGSRSFGDTQ